MTGRPVRVTRQASLRSFGRSFGKDLLTVGAIPRSQVAHLLRLAEELKALQRGGVLHQRLAGATLGLLFEKPSTRTRVSFEAGINQLGGQAQQMRHLASGNRSYRQEVFP